MKNRKTISAPVFWILGAASVFIFILLDQYTKYLAVKHLMGKPAVPLIDRVLELSYLENRGMAFGMFQGKIPVFVVICLVFFAAAAYVCARIPKERYYMPLMLAVFLLCAGVMGNFIDRVFRGFVVDFIYVRLINFPIFNLADIYVVLSRILIVLLVCFKYEEDDLKFLSLKQKG